MKLLLDTHTLLWFLANDAKPLTTLPLRHKDPFDRLLAATALVERLTLASIDSVFDAYGVARLW